MQAEKITLVNLYHAGGVIRLGSQSFITSPDDVPPNISFDGLIKNGVTLSSSVDANKEVGEIDFYISDIDINNIEFTTYDIFIVNKNGSFKDTAIRAGEGVVIGLKIASRGIARIELEDKSFVINADAVDAKDNDVLLPLLLGSVKNITPINTRLSSGDKVYYYSSYDCTIDEVRVGGVALTSYTNNNNGSFTVPNEYNNQGAVTCDITDDSTDTIIKACEYLASLKGFSGINSINASSAAINSMIGYYSKLSISALKVMIAIGGSVGLFPRFNEFGVLELVGSSSSEVKGVISSDDIVINGFSQVSISKKKKINILYNKNWTNQDIDGYTEEYTVFNGVSVNESSVMIETMLTLGSDAAREALRRNALWLNDRGVWRLTAIIDEFTFKIGDTVYIDIDDINPRNGVIIGINKRLSRSLYSIEVIF